MPGNYRSPGVYIEESNQGARPIQASSTSDTGFVALVEIPQNFTYIMPESGVGLAGMLIPSLGDADPAITWTAARAFYGLYWSGLSPYQRPLNTLITGILGPDGKIEPIKGNKRPEKMTVSTGKDAETKSFTIEASRTLLNAGPPPLLADQKLNEMKTVVWNAEKDLRAAKRLVTGKADAEKRSAIGKAIDKLDQGPGVIAKVASLKKDFEAAMGASPAPALKTAFDKIFPKDTDELAAPDLVSLRNKLDAWMPPAAAPAATTPATEPAPPSGAVTLTPTATVASAPTADAATATPATSVTPEQALVDDIDKVVGKLGLLLKIEITPFVNELKKLETLPDLVKTSDSDALKWELSLAMQKDPGQLINQIAVGAVPAKIKFPTDALTQGVANTKLLDINPSKLEKLQEMQEPGQMITGMTTYHAWRKEFGKRLFIELLKVGTTPPMSDEDAKKAWDGPSEEAQGEMQKQEDKQEAWHEWLRHQTGLHHLEVALLGFFTNGGAAAYLGVGIVTNVVGKDPQTHIKGWFDTANAVALICAPGLSLEWQEQIKVYAGNRNTHGDLFAITDTPRYLLTRHPSEEVSLKGSNRWLKNLSPGHYEGAVLQTLKTAKLSELRTIPDDSVVDGCVARDKDGHAAAYAPWLIVPNPLSTGDDDAYVVAPPSGFVAGAYATNDRLYGVQKVPANQVLNGVTELATSITSVEQEPLNVKGINLIRYRPAGKLIWGGRTTAADPLWRYISIRRVFLFIERSIRDALQWAVFLPNNVQTRSDLVSTIAGFLYTQYNAGVLDGATAKQAFSVKCDEENNPIETRRDGYLIVDVGLQPPYPAEFVVIRFKQGA